ncbi:hypothetical protein GCM10028809_21180 [Spirosoma gilvum]
MSGKAHLGHIKAQKKIEKYFKNGDKSKNQQELNSSNHLPYPLKNADYVSASLSVYAVFSFSITPIAGQAN